MARHMTCTAPCAGAPVRVPDNPMAVPPTPFEQAAMWTDDWFSGTACETCAHRITVDCGRELFKGYERKVEMDVCVAAHDLGDGGVCFKLTSKTVRDTCPSWEMEE